MKKHRKLLGIVFIIFLIVIPIGNTTIEVNNNFIIGFRGDYIIHCLIYLPWMFVGKMLFGNKPK